MGGKVDLSQNVVAQGMVTSGPGPVWKTTASGAQKNRGFTAAVVRNGVGDYTVQLDSPYASDDMHIEVNFIPSAAVPVFGPFIVGAVGVTPASPGPFVNIQTKDSAAAPTLVDVDFAIVVTLQEVSH